MNNGNRTCPICASIMKQTGGAHGYVRYHCPSCGNDIYDELKTDENYEYWRKRGELLGRVKEYILENASAYQWEHLSKDILSFTTHYPEANVDIYFTMALIACYTNGFTDMDNDKYKKCKVMFKVTEKVYKRYCKENFAKDRFSKETGDEGFTSYEDYRTRYRKLWYEYQSNKLAWKIIFAMGKSFIKI